MSDHARSRPAWHWFTAWSAVGVMYPWIVLGLFSFGLAILLVAVSTTLVLARRRDARPGIFGLMFGCGLSLLFVAWVSRGGPGEVCTTTPTTQWCAQQWNPWPWLGFGVMLIVFGVGEFLRRQRSAT